MYLNNQNKDISPLLYLTVIVCLILLFCRQLLKNVIVIENKDSPCQDNRPLYIYMILYFVVKLKTLYVICRKTKIDLGSRFRPSALCLMHIMPHPCMAFEDTIIIIVKLGN